MAVSDHLIDRLRVAVADQTTDFEEKKMFGGICFMVRGHMAVGLTNKEALMVRCKKARMDELLEKPHAGPMLFTGKAMNGFLFIEQEGWESEKGLAEWVAVGLEFAFSEPVKIKKEKPKK